MGKIGKDRVFLSASAPKELVDVIDARAEALGWSRAKYMLAVVEMWRAEGAKPINKIDATMYHEVMSKFESGKPAKKTA
jgi:hypothetical protein